MPTVIKQYTSIGLYRKAKVGLQTFDQIYHNSVS